MSVRISVFCPAGTGRLFCQYKIRAAPDAGMGDSARAHLGLLPTGRPLDPAGFAARQCGKMGEGFDDRGPGRYHDTGALVFATNMIASSPSPNLRLSELTT
jgi:hypothetical protein